MRLASVNESSVLYLAAFPEEDYGIQRTTSKRFDCLRREQCCKVPLFDFFFTVVCTKINLLRRLNFVVPKIIVMFYDDSFHFHLKRWAIYATRT